MSQLPKFNPDGLLPPGVYPCDEEEFARELVQAIPSMTRGSIAKKFFMLRSFTVEVHGLVGTQWVNGSFVTEKKNPNDIDVVTFSDYDFLISLNDDAKKFVNGVLASERGSLTQLIFATHHFLVVSCVETHLYYEVYEAARRYWRKWWGQTKDGEKKGFIRMGLGDPERVPIVPED